MSIFKSALRVVAAHPIYLAVYIVWLSFLGVFIVQSMVPSEGGESAQAISGWNASVAVVDQDGSEVSRALATRLADACELVEVADEPRALQDAVATGYADCLIVVPEGFGEEWVAAARGEGEAPKTQVSFGFASASGTVAQEEAEQYLGLIAQAAALAPDAEPGRLVEMADAAASSEAEVVAASSGGAVGAEADLFAQYLMWSAYTMTAGLTVCVGMLMSAFGRTDVRRRGACAPVSPVRTGLQLAAAAFALAVFAWAFSTGLGAAVFGWTLAGVPAQGVALAFAAGLAFSLVPAAGGFLLGQLGAREEIVNAAGNICGLVLSFLGGAWVSVDLLAPEVQAVAVFTPAWWYGEAVRGALSLAPGSLGDAGAILADIGIVALFAVTLVLVALAVGRARLRSAEAGGNAGASRGAGLP